MKWFEHEIGFYQKAPINRAMKKHGPDVYGVYWALLEVLAASDRTQYRIEADWLWLEMFTEHIRLDSPETLISMIDTLSQVGLIDESLWHGTPRILFCPTLRKPPNPYGRPSHSEWQALRSEVFRRDNFTCQYCGATTGTLHCDHIHPISRGGSNQIENLIAACQTCNLRKQNKTPDEWLGGANE